MLNPLKQMIETGNYKSIKFQNDFRSKKPVGIYWLQAFTVNFFSQDIFNEDLIQSIIRYGSIGLYHLYSPFLVV